MRRPPPCKVGGAHGESGAEAARDRTGVAAPARRTRARSRAAELPHGPAGRRRLPEPAAHQMIASTMIATMIHHTHAPPPLAAASPARAAGPAPVPAGALPGEPGEPWPACASARAGAHSSMERKERMERTMTTSLWRKFRHDDALWESEAGVSRPGRRTSAAGRRPSLRAAWPWRTWGALERPEGHRAACVKRPGATHR